MAIPRKDEILEKALSADASAVPRFNLRAPDGTILYENLTLELANVITQSGTPVNAAALNEILAASGVTRGTPTAYILDQEGYYLFEGAPIKVLLHETSGDNPTLNINGTGAFPLMTLTGSMPRGVPEGTWINAIYDSAEQCYFVLGLNGGTRIVTNSRLSSNASSIRIPIPRGTQKMRAVLVALPSSVANTQLMVSMEGCSGANGSTVERKFTNSGNIAFAESVVYARYNTLSGANVGGAFNMVGKARVVVDVVINGTNVAVATKFGGGISNICDGESVTILTANQDDLALVLSASSFLAGTTIFAEAVMV
jgi:hypothetical protein